MLLRSNKFVKFILYQCHTDDAKAKYTQYEGNDRDIAHLHPSLLLNLYYELWVAIIADP